ncbi:integrase xerC [Mycobacterium tuberculosis T92]|nr:integrase xerC [Mycobacterium tuberculosis T92]
MQAILDEFDEYLALQCGRSVHTRRAYLGDLRSLFAFLADRGSSLDALTLSVLRSWLAATAGAGAARTTLARRTSAVKAFTAWAVRRGLLAGDPAARLQVPKARRTLPAVLRQDQALRAMAAAESGAEQGDPLALRDRLIVELLYATGIRVSELCGLDVDDIDTGHRLGSGAPLGTTSSAPSRSGSQPPMRCTPGWSTAVARWSPRSPGTRCCWVPGAGALTCGKHALRCTRPWPRWTAHPIWGRTGCGTARRPTCWKVAPTCGWSRSCSVIPAWRPRSCTPTSRLPGCGAWH